MTARVVERVLYDVLDKYGAYLSDIYTSDTTRAYRARVGVLLEGQYLINKVQDIDLEKVITKLSKIKYKNHFSQYKNALLHLYEFEGVAFPPEYLDKIKELESKTKKKYRKMKVVDFKKVSSIINHMRNKKLKLSYQTMIHTGLRVFELSQIKPKDCLLSPEDITLSFVGKGGNPEQVKLYKSDNKKVFEDLTILIQNTKGNKNVFYSSNYLQQKAKEKGFKCHDLRRAFAKQEYKKTGSKKEVQEKLRHTSIKNTNKYINSKIKL